MNAGLMRSRRVEVHPKLAGQPLATALQVIMPRLQDKQLKTDKIQNAENAIADMVSQGDLFAGVPLLILLTLYLLHGNKELCYHYANSCKDTGDIEFLDYVYHKYIPFT